MFRRMFVCVCQHYVCSLYVTVDTITIAKTGTFFHPHPVSFVGRTLFPPVLWIMPDWNLGEGEEEVEEEALMHCPAMNRLKHCACLHQSNGRGLFLD